MRKILLLAAFLFTCASGAARAEVIARVAAVQQKVEVSSAGRPYTRVEPGFPLSSGDMVRTGRRSKADIKFADGSLIRLSQLSGLLITAPREVKLTAGKLLLSYMKPGRVIAGTAAAEIKGTVATVEIDGADAEYALYEGHVDVVSGNQRQTMAAGQAVRALSDGTLSGLRSAAPLFYAKNGAPLDLLDTPQGTPFVGSKVDTFERGSSSAIAARESGDNGGKGSERGKGRGKGGTVLDKDSSSGGKGRGDNGDDDNSGPGGGDNSGPGSGENLTAAATALRVAGAGPLAFGAPSVPSTAGSTAFRQSGARVLVAQLPLPAGGNEGATATRATDVANESADTQYLSAAAQARLRQLKGSKGKTSGFDVRAIGVAADGGVYAYGARVHGFVAKGNWLLDGAVQPLRLKTSESTLDLSAVSDLSLTYRSQAGQVQLGRQRFLSGPVQATLYGSLVRQGAREIMDAVRISPTLKGKQSLELAYLADAYPHNLPYRISGRQRGFYARYAMERGANLGLNLLKYSNLDTPSTLGATVDFALPLVRRQIDLYGEAGRDTYRRRMTTLGLSFPGLYDRTGYDVYLELANLGGSSIAERPPTEVALRAYRKVNDNLDVVGSASRFSDGDTAAAIGISIGSRIAER